MNITPIKTHKITKKDTDIIHILDQYVTHFSEKSVLAVTSKIVSITEGRTQKISEIEKDELVRNEAQYILPRSSNKYNINFAITHNMLAAGAGIDESNGNGEYVLWPEDPQKSANTIREYLTKRFKISFAGVILTDSRTAPLRWGVTGVAIAHSGFLALKDYIGTPDLFGRPFQFEKLNIADSLAAGSVFVMGEGSEQTPLAVITGVGHVAFQDRDPSFREIADFKIGLEDDLYAPFLTSVPWEKGKK